MPILRIKSFSLSFFLSSTVFLVSPLSFAKITGPCSILLGKESDLNTAQTQLYTSYISASQPSISDHRMGSAQEQATLYPGTAYWDGVFTAAALNEMSNDNSIVSFENTAIAKRPLLLPEAKEGIPAEEYKLQTEFRSIGKNDFEVSIHSSRKEKPGQLRFGGKGQFKKTMSLNKSDFQFDSTQPIATLDSQAFYANLAERGLAYGASYRGLQNIEIQGNKSRARIVLNPAPDFSAHSVPPAVLDNALHAVAAVLTLNQPGWPIAANEAALPTSFESVEFNSKAKISADEELFVNTRVQSVEVIPNEGLQIKYDVILTNASGEVIVSIRQGVFHSAKLI